MVRRLVARGTRSFQNALPGGIQGGERFNRSRFWLFTAERAMFDEILPDGFRVDFEDSRKPRLNFF